MGLIFLLIVVNLIPFIVTADERKQKIVNAAQYEKGFRYNIQGWTFIHLEGDPYERGYQYGYLASAEIENTFKRWANTGHEIPFTRNPPKDYYKLSEAWWKTCKEKSMNYFEKHVPEEYKEEMRGMMDGLNEQGVKMFGKSVKYADIVAAQFIQDVWYGFYYDYSYRKFHPIRSLIFGIRDLFLGNKDYGHLGHCNAFIATGDATEDGEIVVAHATQFQLSIAQRVNFIVDVNPTSGYRFIMAAPPGSIWSQEDYYQNEKGIILTESELVPQGPFNLRKTPKGVRSRLAIQYSSTIDEVISTLQKGNNGLIPNEWLIGDTKTGEIARLEQAFFHTPITRKNNGYFFTCKAPHNKKVERELWGLRSKALILRYNIPTQYQNPTIMKFDELAEIYYGKINEEIAIKMMTTTPISKTTDCKITTSSLLEDMGLYIHFGKCDGIEFNSTKKIDIYRELTILPSLGWTKIFDSNLKETGFKFTDIRDEESKVIWEFKQKDQFNMNHSSVVISDNTLFAADSSGQVFSLDLENGRKYWDIKLAERAVGIESFKETLFIGTNKGLFAIVNENGRKIWEKNLGRVISKPVVSKDSVIVGFSDGKVSGFDIESGNNIWSYSFDDIPYISESKNNLIFIGADKSCYGFDLEKQKIIWEFKTDKKVTACPKIDQKTVYFGSWDGNLYALDYKTGNLKWKYQTGWGIDSTPEVSERIVYIGGLDNNFYALDKNSGELVWFFTCKSAIHSNPLVYGELVFFGCDDGRLYSLEKETGETAWSFTPGYSLDNYKVNNYIITPVLSDPAAENGIVYISAKGNIYALDAQTIEEKKNDNKSRDDGLLLYIYLFLLFIGIAILVRTYLKIKEK
jgi:outer membrane protein assembly factor BamB